MKRVNFVADRVSDTELPGVKRIVKRVAESNGSAMTAEALVEQCLDLMGPVEMGEHTRGELLSHAESEGSVSWATDEEYTRSARRVGDMLALIAATREYQFG